MNNLNPQSTVLVRCGDAIAALGTARSYRRALTKIDLQKFVYLMDVIGYLYDTLPPPEHHRTYFYGPYDVNLQNAIDTLTFRGLVLARNIEKTKKGGIRAIYELSQAGLAFATHVENIRTFKKKFHIADLVARNLEEYGWNRIVDLVYGEPTFMSAKVKGYGQKLKIQDGLDNSAAAIFRVIEQLAKAGVPQTSLSNDYVADLFASYLSEMATRRPRI